MGSDAIIRYVSLVALLLGATFSSCDRAAGPEAGSEPERGIQVGFRLALSGLAATRAGYDDGSQVDFENHVGIERGDYRILFFDMRNRYLSDFRPTDFAPVEAPAYRAQFYDVLGEIADPLPEEFKVVVLANWGTYPQTLQQGVTTIEELCSCPESVYGYAAPFVLGERLIPMYGVKSCEGLLFAPDSYTSLGTVHLLRAMAKIEVVCTSGQWTVDEVTLHRYNGSGCSAPQHAESESDYLRPDYVEELHLPAARNDAEVKELAFRRISDNRYVVYVPEYRNVIERTTGSKASDAAEIRVRFAQMPGREYPVEFKYYTEVPDGHLKGDSFDIRRNYYYRFSISKSAEPDISVDVYPYEQVELDPGFGLTPKKED